MKLKRHVVRDIFSMMLMFLLVLTPISACLTYDGARDSIIERMQNELGWEKGSELSSAQELRVEKMLMQLYKDLYRDLYSHAPKNMFEKFLRSFLSSSTLADAYYRDLYLIESLKGEETPLEAAIKQELQLPSNFPKTRDVKAISSGDDGSVSYDLRGKYYSIERQGAHSSIRQGLITEVGTVNTQSGEFSVRLVEEIYLGEPANQAEVKRDAGKKGGKITLFRSGIDEEVLKIEGYENRIRKSNAVRTLFDRREESDNVILAIKQHFWHEVGHASSSFLDDEADEEIKAYLSEIVNGDPFYGLANVFAFSLGALSIPIEQRTAHQKTNLRITQYFLDREFEDANDLLEYLESEETIEYFNTVSEERIVEISTEASRELIGKEIETPLGVDQELIADIANLYGVNGIVRFWSTGLSMSQIRDLDKDYIGDLIEDLESELEQEMIPQKRAVFLNALGKMNELLGNLDLALRNYNLAIEVAQTSDTYDSIVNTIEGNIESISQKITVEILGQIKEHDPEEDRKELMRFISDKAMEIAQC